MFLVLTSLACGSQARTPDPQGLVGQSLPPIEGVDAASLTGRVVVVKFFAEWCRPCVRTLPEAQWIHENNEDVAMIGVSIDDTDEAASRVIALHHLTFRVVRDGERNVAQRFGADTLPIVFVTDRHAKICWAGDPRAREGGLRVVIDECRR